MRLPVETYLSIVLYHDVTIVSVTDAQNKSGHTITGTGSCKQVNGHVIPTVRGKKKRKNNINYALLKQNVVYCHCKGSHLALVLVL